MGDRYRDMGMGMGPDPPFVCIVIIEMNVNGGFEETFTSSEVAWFRLRVYGSQSVSNTDQVTTQLYHSCD